mmetsp:Transcript_28636/g.41000  ORF Transcript_28636/g.41000 Transcript_28636/m.41000 type:complete len:148 (+) Transcript_28636:390-833(+)
MKRVGIGNFRKNMLLKMILLVVSLCVEMLLLGRGLTHLTYKRDTMQSSNPSLFVIQRPIMDSFLFLLRHLDAYPILTSDNDSSCHATKQTMIYNSYYILDFGCHLNRILDRAIEMQVNNVVAIVSNGNIISVDLVVGGGPHTKNGLA